MSNSLSGNKAEPWDGFLVHQGERQVRRHGHELTGKRILVTGAGGWIGSALARRLVHLLPEQLVLLDIAEQGLFLLDHDLQRAGVTSNRTVSIGSICDQSLMEELFARYRPQIVFHAAAYKHVLLMETNPFAAVETNVLGTRVLLQTARRYGTQQCIFLSTDKAVDPISLMGATKRLAELLVLASHGPAQMKALRLCNVLGSSGSVAPLFCDQIRGGGPVTVTDPEAKRFFISTEDAVEWLIHVASIDCASGLYVPPTGDPYRIADLARYLIRSMKCLPAEETIVYTGLRIGDKLHESMTSAREETISGKDGLSRVVDKVVFGEDEVTQVLTRLTDAVRHRDIARLLHTLEATVPEYATSSVLRDLLHTMERRRS